MNILISKIPEEGLDLELSETVESDVICSPITARLKIVKIGSEIMVAGEMRADATLQCSRCLKEFLSNLSVPVDVVYHPLTELKGDERHEIATKELDLDFYSGEEMDIAALLKEQILLNLPMKPLCGEFCKGICLKCGKDLNINRCTCDEQDADTRGEVLKRLLDKM